MKWRRIGEREAQETIANPERVEVTVKGRENAFKKVDGRLLKITYRIEKDEAVVITAIAKGAWVMKIEYDKEVDALYIRLQEKYVTRTVELEEGLNLDLDENGKLIGLEVLDATERYSLADIFNVSTENLILGNQSVADQSR